MSTTEDNDALDLQHPHRELELLHAISHQFYNVHRSVFVQDRARTRWKCTLCSTHQFESLRKARQHEDTRAHTQAVRSLDVWPPSDTGPADSTGRQSSPEPLFTLWESPMFDEANDNDGPQLGIHGPALPGDAEDQIYDNFGGPLAASIMDPYTLQEDVLSDEDSLDWDRELKSDGPLDLSSDIPLLSEQDHLDETEDEPDPNAEDWWPWPTKEVSIYTSCLSIEPTDTVGPATRKLYWTSWEPFQGRCSPRWSLRSRAGLPISSEFLSYLLSNK